MDHLGPDLQVDAHIGGTGDPGEPQRGRTGLVWGVCALQVRDSGHPDGRTLLLEPAKAVVLNREGLAA